MFGKKFRNPFKIEIDKEQAEKDRNEYMAQPPEVLKQLEMCRNFMLVFIPAAAIAVFLLPIFIALPVCTAAGASAFLFMKFRKKEGWKLSLVPGVCILIGIILGLMLMNLLKTIRG